MKLLLNMSEAAILGLHAVEVIAESEGLRTTPDIAEELGVSYNHLAKVMQRLTRSGLVAPVRGPKGGFRLTARGAAAAVGDVVEAIEGKAEYANCLMGAKHCKRTRCPFRGFLNESNRRFEAVLRTKIASFTRQTK